MKTKFLISTFRERLQRKEPDGITGKEPVTQAIHSERNRWDKPLVEANCSALSESVLESELFGYVKGAFTGTNRNKIQKTEFLQS